MESMGTIGYSRILRIITDICIIVNVVSLIGLFWIARLLVDYLTDVFGWSEPYWFILAFFYVCGAMTLGILLQGHLILRTLERNHPFDEENAKRFFRVGVLCLVLAIAFTIKIFMYNTLLTIAGTAIFALASLIAFILSDVFSRAAKIWEEHQLTI